MLAGLKPGAVAMAVRAGRGVELPAVSVAPAIRGASRLRVGILGAAGYAGRELVRLVCQHPRLDLTFATSETESGTPLRGLARAAPDLALVRADMAPLGSVDVVFSCLPHGVSRTWCERARRAGARVIDLSSDFRMADEASSGLAATAVYGLTELFREQIRGADLVANPGCYPTGAILSIAPLVRRGLVGGAPIIINAASGATGAGRAATRELLFAEVGEDFRTYAPGNTHRHLPEMRTQLARLGRDRAPELVFTPHLLPIRRGILESIYVPITERLSTDAAIKLWIDDYDAEPFVEVLRSGIPAVADVVGTNRLAIGVVPITQVTSPLLLVVCALDNLLKGASGQAIQNLNLMSGWSETEGLGC